MDNSKVTADILSPSQVFYIPYWILLLFALINHLGETDQLAGPLHEVKASKVSFKPQNRTCRSR